MDNSTTETALRIRRVLAAMQPPRDKLLEICFRLALIQLKVGASKSENLSKAADYIAKAAKGGAQVVSLPECCNSLYGNDYFADNAESIPGPSTKAYSEAAKQNNVYVVAGSIPESRNSRLYNTCTVYNPLGELIAKYSKVHLFDIDIPGKITFKESDSLSPGTEFVDFDTPFAKIGLGICYDIRFAEMAQILAKRGCKLLLYPGCFNMTTGPAHWELLQRGRAVDNQVYVSTISQARDETGKYVAWGHSTVVNPWGKVISTTAEEEDVIYADIDLNYLNEVRNQIPITKQKRDDMYSVTEKKP